MAEARDVDWVAIRLEWETSSKSDQAIADQFGFKSANTILRKRKGDGWRRSKEMEHASRVARAVRDTPLDPRVSADVCVRPDAHTHAETQQIQDRAAESGLGVCAVSGDGEDRSASRPPADRMDDVHTARPTGTAVGETRQQAAARYMRDLDMIRVEAIKRQLATAERLRETGERILRAVYVVFCRPGEVATIEDLWAHQALKSVNPDKDTIAGMTKSAAGMLDVAGAMERKVLGMEAPPRKADEQVTGPAASIRPEDVLPMLSLLSLEDWGNAARKATLMRPMLEGSAEPVVAR